MTKFSHFCLSLNLGTGCDRRNAGAFRYEEGVCRNANAFRYDERLCLSLNFSTDCVACLAKAPAERAADRSCSKSHSARQLQSSRPHGNLDGAAVTTPAIIQPQQLSLLEPVTRTRERIPQLATSNSQFRSPCPKSQPFAESATTWPRSDR